MVVNEVDSIRALKSVSDSFKIPWLYSIEALFKRKDAFASLPTGSTVLIFRAAPIVADELLFSSICTHLKSSRATRFVYCS